MSDEQEFLTINETAALLRVSRATIYRYIKEGHLVPSAIGGVTRIARQQLMQSLNVESLGPVGAQVIAVASQKGGTNKSSFCISLSGCLSAMGKRVLLVDLDSQANASQGLGFDLLEIENLDKSMYNVFSQDSFPLENCILETRFPNLDLAPADDNLAKSEMDLMTKMLYREQVLERKLKPVIRNYDYIFLDCPPSLSNITINALMAADSIVVPVLCEYFPLKGLRTLRSIVNQIITQDSYKRLTIVPTMFDKRLRVHKTVLAKIRTMFQEELSPTTIPVDTKMKEANINHMPINYYEPGSPASLAFERLSKELMIDETPES